MQEGSRQLPVTGAWRPGDPVGRRHFLELPEDRTFVLEGGGQPEQSGWFSTVWERQADGWRVIHDHSS